MLFHATKFPFLRTPHLPGTSLEVELITSAFMLKAYRREVRQFCSPCLNARRHRRNETKQVSINYVLGWLSNDRGPLIIYHSDATCAAAADNKLPGCARCFLWFGSDPDDRPQRPRFQCGFILHDAKCMRAVVVMVDM